MKKNKLILSAAFVFCAACVFASEGALPAASVDWPEKLGMTPKMLFLVLQIGIILFAAKLGGMLAGLFKLPSVLGELAAGIVIGPWALGGIPIPGFDGMFREGLFFGHALRAQATAGANPFAATPELYGICTIASVVLLFLSGIETNLKMFLKYAFAGSLVGIGGVVFSFLLGDFAAVYATTLLPDTLGGIQCLADLGAYVQAGEVMKAVLSPAALFMGIMSTATSVGITARILSEKKKMDSEEGVTIMAGAVIDDVLGIIVLAIGMGIIASQQEAGASVGVKWGAIGETAASAFGVWLGGTLLGVVFARRISWLLKLFKSPVAIATLAFGLSLIIAGVFEAFGLTLIIGAYVMGLALSRTDIKHLVQENLQSLYTFFVPIFFCVMGMMVDLSALCSKPVLIFGGIYTVLAVFAKIIGCAIPSFFCGFNVLGSLRVGAGMIPRGEVALIIAGIGLSNGFLTQEVFGIGILMTLVTTIVAPPALVGLFTSKKKGVRHPKQNHDGMRDICFELGSESVADLMLVKLVAEFREEGFFTTCLSAADNIWEVAMNDIEIVFRREGNSIRVFCTPAEEAIMMTAWMEVASEMNDLARSIAKPIRRADVDQMLSKTATDVKAGRSGVGRYLQGFVMLPKFRASSKKEAIEKMVSEIAAACPRHVKNTTSAIEAVLQREASMPTGLDRGIAVPHGRTPDVIGIVGAVAIVDNEGTVNGCLADYETIDHSPVSIVVLTLANSESQTPYLQLMSFISKALRGSDGAQRLAACTTADEMRRFFRNVK